MSEDKGWEEVGVLMLAMIANRGAESITYEVIGAAKPAPLSNPLSLAVIRCAAT